MSFRRYESYKNSGVEWLGEVPKHWRCDPIGAVSTCNDEVLTETTAPDFEIQYVEISDVEHGPGICGSSTVLFAEAPSRARRRVKDGDVIVSTVRTYLKAIAQVISPPENMIVSTGFAVIRPRSVYSKFLGHLVASEYVIAEVISHSVGVSYPAINASEVMRIKVPLPPSNEQKTIAAFLDRETAKIDALVEDQQRLITLLKEKRQAVISHAVTKGLDPNAPMKDSGVEWLGAVPAHWEVLSLARVTTDKCDGPFGSGLKSEHYTDDGVRVIRLQNIRQNGFDGSDAAFIDLEYYRRALGGHDVKSGDVLIAGLGDERNTVGRACVAPLGIEPAMVKADCFRFRVNDLMALAPFVATQLTSGSPFDAGVLSSGSTRSRIPLSVTATRKLAIPPLPEQSVILEFLQNETRNIDALLDEAETAIALLQERRSALISAAVTGKIDVRGLAASQAEAA